MEVHTKGVDRLWFPKPQNEDPTTQEQVSIEVSTIIAYFIESAGLAYGADVLWESFQQGIHDFVGSGNVIINTPEKNRPENLLRQAEPLHYIPCVD